MRLLRVYILYFWQIDRMKYHVANDNKTIGQWCEG